MPPVPYTSLNMKQQQEVLDFYRNEFSTFNGRRRYLHHFFKECVGDAFGKSSKIDMTYEVNDKNNRVNLYMTISACEKKAIKEFFSLVYPDYKPHELAKLPIKTTSIIVVTLVDNDVFVTPTPRDGVTIFSDQFFNDSVTEDIAQVFGVFYTNLLDELNYYYHRIIDNIDGAILDRIKDESFLLAGDIVLLPAIPKEKEETERNDYLD